MSILIEAAVTERRKVHVLEVDAYWRAANYARQTICRSAKSIFWTILCYESTHAAIPNVPGLKAAQPLTHVEIGGGYSGVELAQAYRRFSSDVTIIDSGPQLLAREDIDVSQEMRRILSSGGITNKLIRRYRKL